MKKASRVTPLADVLQRVLQELVSEGSTREQMQEVWARIAGAEAARHSWPRKMLRRRLVVEVENSGWMYALSLRKEALLIGLVELLGAAKVKGLSFRMGEGKDA